MNNLRHWFIQKPIAHNCPINQGKGVQHEAAVFTEFMPTQVLQNCEWIKVYSADDYEQLKSKLKVAVVTMQRRMKIDDVCELPFDEDMAETLKEIGEK